MAADRAGVLRTPMTGDERRYLFKLVADGADRAYVQVALQPRNKTTIARSYNIVTRFKNLGLTTIDDETATKIARESLYNATAAHVQSLFHTWISWRNNPAPVAEVRSTLDPDRLEEHRRTLLYFGLRLRDSLVFPRRFHQGLWSGTWGDEPSTAGELEIDKHWTDDAISHPVYPYFREHLARSLAGTDVLDLIERMMSDWRNYVLEREAAFSAAVTAIENRPEADRSRDPRFFAALAVHRAMYLARSGSPPAPAAQNRNPQPTQDSIEMRAAEQIAGSVQIRQLLARQDQIGILIPQIKMLLTPEDLVFRLVRDGHCELCRGPLPLV